MGSKEKDWKVTNVMLQALDVGGNQARVADLSGPPSVVAQLDPDYLLIVGLLARFAFATQPRPLRHLYFQALRVERGRTGLATQQSSSFPNILFGSSSTDETPAYVYRRRKVSVLSGAGVVATYDDVRCYQNTASCHTAVSCVIGHWTADTSHHTTFASFLKVSVETASGTAVLRAAQAFGVRGGASVLPDTGFMVITSTTVY